MHTRHHSPIPGWQLVLVARAACCLLLLVILGTLAACGSSPLSGPAMHATATAQANTDATAATQATRIAQPVLLVAQVAQEGTLAARNAQLVVTFTVTNQTTQPIHLARDPCHDPSRVFEFEVDQGQQMLWASWVSNQCTKPAYPAYDVLAVAAGATYTTTITGNLEHVTELDAPLLQAGTPYTIICSLVLWHQGTMDQLAQPGVPSGNDLTVSIPFTIR